MRLVVTYDISSDKKRKKVSDLLEMLLVRVQKSVFEGEVPEGPLAKTVRKAVRLVDKEEGDSLRVYRLCAACVPRVESFGREVYVEDEEVQVF